MPTAHALPRILRRWRLARAIRSARHRGHGLYFTEWQATQPPESVAAEVLQWCRETLGRCRRPMGIDHFDLTLTLHGPGVPQTHRMAFLRPLQLYDEAALPAALATLLAPLTLSDGGGWRVAASLLSWGDVAHAALPA